MSKKISIRFLSIILTLITVLSIGRMIPATAAEDYSSGGWNQVKNTSTIVNSSGGSVGTVYAGEGVTVLYFSGDRAYIEYSASNSPKQGFISTSNLVYNRIYSETAVGRISSSTSTYYSPTTAHYAGSVSSGEYVAVLCNNNSWAYIEYNISGGQRKRAFIRSSCLYCYSHNANYSLYQDDENLLGIGMTNITSNRTVYAGPDKDAYPSIGTVYPSDNYNVWAFIQFKDGSGNKVNFVEYPTDKGPKYGYIYSK